MEPLYEIEELREDYQRLCSQLDRTQLIKRWQTLSLSHLQVPIEEVLCTRQEEFPEAVLPWVVSQRADPAPGERLGPPLSYVSIVKPAPGLAYRYVYVVEQPDAIWVGCVYTIVEQANDVLEAQLIQCGRGVADLVASLEWSLGLHPGKKCPLRMVRSGAVALVWPEQDTP